MKRTFYNWQYGDCLYRIEEWRNAPKDVCPFSVYMLSSKNGNGSHLFCWILFEQKRCGRCHQKKCNKNLES